MNKETFSSPRYGKERIKQGKWNLAPWLFSSVDIPFLQSRLEELLKSLYSHTPFWTDHLEKHLLVQWRQLVKEGLPLHQLSDLFPEDPSLHFSFYRMLKGASNYNPETGQGYPSLSDFFYLDENSPQTLCFPSATPPLLQAFFGTELAQEILVEEEKNKKILTKEELFVFLSEKRAISSFSNIEAYCLFSRKKTTHDELIYQAPEGIRLQYSSKRP
ncbi:MAG: hypothetical protein FJZ58_03885 [Chlamydiae bacterium]|nr:hypothetical protein [Chlamydiota bacterium]